MTRICRTCNIEKELEAFPKDTHSYQGRRRNCNDCRKAYHRVNSKKYYLKHKEDKKVKVMVYHFEHKQEIAERKKLYHRQPHRREIERLRSAARRADKSGNKHRAYLARKYYAKKFAASGYCSKQLLEARWQYYGHKCWICRDVATETDHVKPLSKGGTNWPANLRPICKPCNVRKSNTWPYTKQESTSSH